MTKQQRLFDIYTGTAIAILLLMSSTNATWMAISSIGLLVAGLVVFPAERQRIAVVGVIGALTAVMVAALVRFFA